MFMNVLPTIYMPGTQRYQKWVSDTLELELGVFESHQVIQMQVLLIIKHAFKSKITISILTCSKQT